MAEVKFPIHIDGFRCVEDVAQAVLGYTYKEKTLKEWADSISEPTTKADQIRTMTDQGLAEWIESLEPAACPYRDDHGDDCRFTKCADCWIDWLKQEAE